MLIISKLYFVIRSKLLDIESRNSEDQHQISKKKGDLPVCQIWRKKWLFRPLFNNIDNLLTLTHSIYITEKIDSDTGVKINNTILFRLFIIRAVKIRNKQAKVC